MVSGRMQDSSYAAENGQQGETMIWLTEAGPGKTGKLPSNSVTTLRK